MRIIGFSLVFALLSFACTTGTDNKGDGKEKAREEKQEAITGLNEDNSPAGKPGSRISTAEQTKNHKKIVAKYGEQWDFCKCVNIHDSINNAFRGTLDENQSEKLMVRWEFIENKCREFLTNPSTTPAEREAHEREVSKCLEESKRQ